MAGLDPAIQMDPRIKFGGDGKEKRRRGNLAPFEFFAWEI
jgi:hypothetical protein